MNKRPNAAILAVRRAVRKVLRHRKFALRFSLVGLLIAAMTLSGTNTAFAAGGVVTQYINGGPTATAARGDVINLKAGVPVADAGSLTQSITQWIDPLKMKLRSSSDITAPFGWVISYTTDGTNWTQTAPTTASGWAAVKGVKATGAINSEGPDQQGNQIASGNATAAYPSGGSFTMPGASGDGFDVIFDDRGNLYNIWHHNSNGVTTGMDCHTRAGARCAGSWPFTWAPGGANPQTAYRSSGWYDVVEDELWFSTEATVNGVFSAGFACVDLRTNSTPSWCGGSIATGFIAAQSAAGCASSYSCVLGNAQYNGKLFTWNAVTGDIICVDVRANSGLGAPCVTPATSWASISAANLAGNPLIGPSITANNDRIYGTDWQNMVCVMAETQQPCPGWETPKTLTASATRVFKVTSTNGTYLGICGGSWGVVQCFNDAGTEITSSVSATFIAAYKASINYSLDFTANNPQNVGTRLYWADGDYGAGKLHCWDFGTNAWCPNWGNAAGIASKNYTITVDPQNETCLWTNTDDGTIKTFDGISGTNTCAQRSITFDAGVIVPRMGCSPTSAVKSWRTFTLTGPPVADYTSATLTVRTEDGSPVVGWTDVPITTASGRIVDLSTLPVASTGQRPKFIVSFTGRTTGTNATAKVSAIGDAPELCITPQTTVCPTSVTALGPYPTSALPPAEAVNVFADSDSTDGFLSVTQLTRGNATLNLPAVPLTRCSNTLTGRAVDASAAAPQGIRGATVTLKDSTGAILNYPSDYPTVALRGQPITTLTDASGNYSFGNLVPGSYKVMFTDAAIGDVYSTTVTAGGTGTTGVTTNVPGTVSSVTSNAVAVAVATGGVVNAIYYNTAQAFPDVSTGVQGAPQDISVLSNDTPGSSSNVATTWTKSTFKFCATGETSPTCTQASKTVPGEGTYTYNSTTGVVTFTPEPGFVGTATTVNYQVTDGYSNTRSSTITPTVTAATPTNDSGAIRNDQTWVSNLRTNDNLGSEYSYAAASTPAKGSVVVNADGTFTYTPNEGSSGTDTFLYTATAPPICPAGGTRTELYNGTLNGNAGSLNVVTGASALDRQANNLVTNGDFSFSASGVSSATNTYYRWSPNSLGTAPNLGTSTARAPYGWTAAGGGTKAYAMWGDIQKWATDIWAAQAGAYFNLPDNGASKYAINFANTQNGVYGTVSPAIASIPWVGSTGTTRSNVTLTTTTADTGSTGPLSISQNLATTVGKTYRVHFYYTNDWLNQNSQDAIMALEIGDYGNTYLKLDTNSKRWTFDFVATSTSTKIAFKFWGQTTGYTREPVIDDVIGVECAPGAVKTATATVTISGPPKAVLDSSSALTNLPQVVTPLTNDSVSTSVASGGVSLDPSTLRLCGPTETAPSCTQTTVTVANRGTYSLDVATSRITFTPVTDYFGSPGPVRYIITDTAQLTSSALYQPVVEPRPAVPAADRTTGDQGVAQTITLSTNDVATPGTTMTANTTRLCAANETAPTCTATTLTVTGQGTYVVNTTTGVVTFTPSAMFIGVATPINYIVMDSLNRTVTSTYTPTVLGPVLRKYFQPSTVKAGQVTTLFLEITNTANMSAKTGINFTDTLPAGLVVANPPLAQMTCGAGAGWVNTGGNMTAVAGATSVSVVNGSINANVTRCHFMVNVVAANNGTYSNGASNITNNVGITKPVSPGVLTVQPSADSATFPCMEEAIISTHGIMWYYNPATGYKRQIGNDNVNDVEAMGWNSMDGYIYAVASTAGGGIAAGDLVKISSDGSVTGLGQVSFNGSPLALTGVYAGTMNNGYLYVTKDSQYLYKIDVKTEIATRVALTPNLGIHDMFYKDGFLWSNEYTHRFKINPDTGATSYESFTQGWNFSHGLMEWVDLQGNTYSRSYFDGSVFKLTGTPGPIANMTILARQVISAGDRSDGTSCDDATPNPATRPDASSAKQGLPQTINPTTNDFGSTVSGATIDPTSVKLCDANEVAPNCSLTTRTIAGQGTYTVNPSTGEVTFVPLSTFSGVATPIKYQVKDDKGEASLGTITMTSVAPPAPVADTSTGAYLATQTSTVMTNDVVGAGGSTSGTTLVALSARLCDSTNTAPNCSATTVTIAGQGTYTLNTSTGVITFTPVIGFTGAATPVRYSVTDSLGQKNTTTYTPTVGLAPTITKSFEPRVIPAGGVATLSITVTNVPGNPAQSASMSFTDTLPEGLVAASTTNERAVCTTGAGVVTTKENPDSLVSTPGSRVITYTNASSITSGVAKCEFFVSVTAASPGLYTNDASNISSTTMVPPTAGATLEVRAPQSTGANLCTPYAYHIDLGQLYVQNPVTGANNPIGPDHGGQIQALGYNNQDGYLYGYVIVATTNPAVPVGRIVKISSNGTLTAVGTPTLSGVAMAANTNVYAGDMDDSGNLVMLASWSSTTTAYKINVSTLVATQITLSTGVALQDIAFSNGVFYGAEGSVLTMITTNATNNWPVTTKTISTPLASVTTTAMYTNSTEMYFNGHVNSFNKVNNYKGTTPFSFICFKYCSHWSNRWRHVSPGSCVNDACSNRRYEHCCLQHCSDHSDAGQR